MAVTITEYDETTVSLVGVVLSHSRVQVNVSSDHAMIDSGSRLRVEYWDAENWRVRTDDFRTDDVSISAEVDATDEVRRLAEKYRRAASWFQAVRYAYMALIVPVIVGRSRNYWTSGDMTNIKVGDPVEVYKGRKCPKGTYEVAKIGESDYGHYVHLRAPDGTWHRYINPDNLARPKPTDAQLAEAALGKTGKPGTEFHAMVTGILASGNKAAGWLALTDWLMDKGKDDEAMILRGLLAETGVRPPAPATV